MIKPCRSKLLKIFLKLTSLQRSVKGESSATKNCGHGSEMIRTRRDGNVHVAFFRSAESFEIFNDRASCHGGGSLCTRVTVILHCLQEAFPMQPARYTRHRSSNQARAGLLHHIHDLLSSLCLRWKWPRESRRVTRSCLYFSSPATSILRGNIKTTEKRRKRASRER